MGIPELDKMMGGGILEGDSILVAGPSGTGKTVLATQFIAEGLRQGEAGILAVFEERPKGYMDRAGGFGLNLKAAGKWKTCSPLRSSGRPFGDENDARASRCRQKGRRQTAGDRFAGRFRDGAVARLPRGLSPSRSTD